MLLRNSLLTVSLLLSLSANSAVSFTDYRIFMDKKSSKQDFLLFNRGLESHSCDISLIDYDVTSDGKLTPLPKSQKAENSAQPYIRISPRKIQITGQATQKVKILARGFNRAKTNELHSYLSIKCIETSLAEQNAETAVVPENELKSTSFRTSIVNRIPLIIRKDHKPVDIGFSNVNVSTQDGYTEIDLNLTRDGDRSIYGAITVADDQGNLLATRAGISSYIQTSSLNKKLRFKTTNTSTYTISFKEDGRYGGTESKSITISNSGQPLDVVAKSLNQ